MTGSTGSTGSVLSTGSTSEVATGADAWAVAASVLDPEVPVLTIADLGILRDVEEGPDGVTVTITPTYSGCPAMDAIRDDILDAFRHAGRDDVRVEFVLAPAWTTDWITEDGRRKLGEFGIRSFGCSPKLLPDVIERLMKGQDLSPVLTPA